MDIERLDLADVDETAVVSLLRNRIKGDISRHCRVGKSDETSIKTIRVPRQGSDGKATWESVMWSPWLAAAIATTLIEVSQDAADAAVAAYRLEQQEEETEATRELQRIAESRNGRALPIEAVNE